MEEEGETDRKRKAKFRSCRRKKRKGFHGKKAWEMRRETEANDLESPVNTSVKTCVEPQPSTSKAQTDYDDFLARTAPANMSERKLMNSSFENFNNLGATTRSQTASCAGIHEKAHGFKLQDAELLSQCMENQLSVAHAEMQTQVSSFFKITLIEMALLNLFI